jgi:tetratricopeptide (TPR) repeat protein
MPRLPSLAHCALLAASALPALALAKGSPPAAQSQSRVMVFVGAEDRGAEGGALKLGALVEEAVGRNEKQKLVSLADAAGERLSSEVRAAQRASEDDLTSGKKLLQEGKLDEAEAALHSSIKNAEVAAAAFGKIDDFAEAHAALAAVLHLKHRDDDAKDALIEALVLEPTYRPDAKLGGPLAELFRTVRREATPR